MKRNSFNNVSKERGYRRLAAIARVLVGVGCGISAAFAFAQADTSRNGLTVSIPNGYAHINVDDMTVMSTTGPVRWGRSWNGKEWKFNPHWESLSQSWTNMTGSMTGSGAGEGGMHQAVPNDAENGCWVMVDEDWQPSASLVTVGGSPLGVSMLPERITPFNRLMGEASNDYAAPRMMSLDYATLCKGVALGAAPVRDVEALRLRNELYLGEGGRYAYSNRSILEKRAVRALPVAAAATLDRQLAAGSIVLAPVVVEKGFRWMDKAGEWIDYNTQGQVVAYGDKNDNTIWLARDTTGTVRGVIDANGRVVYTLHYSGALLDEVRDYPIAGIAGDLPARSVKYQYDAANRLTAAVDVRGNTTRYGYDISNNIVSITDQEGRIETLAYTGISVAQHAAPDGGVTKYDFEYDEVNKEFTSRITGPETVAGRRVEDFTHNRSGKLVRHTINGRINEEVIYDSADRSEKHKNARGFTKRYIFNEFDQIVQYDREDGTTLKYSYSALNLLLTSSIDAAGIITSYQYDGKGNRIKKLEAAGTSDVRVTEYVLDRFGHAVKIIVKGRTETDASITRDAETRITYDNIGNVEEIADAEGNVRRFQHDRLGNVIMTTDPRGYSSRSEFNSHGLLVKTTDPLAKHQYYEYDKVGNVIVEIDMHGRQTRYRHDFLNRLTQITSPQNGVKKIAYDASGEIVEIIDEDGRRINAEYDNFNRLSRLIDALGNVTSFNYKIHDGTNSGALGSLEQPTEIVFPTYSERKRYDRLERPALMTVVEPVFGERTKIRSYNPLGMLETETDAYGELERYEHDFLGQPVTAIDKLGNITRFAYDARGNIVKVSTASGDVRRYEYDLNNRLIREILPLGQTFKYSYDNSGNISTILDPNGYKTGLIYDAKDRIIERRSFDKADRLMSAVVSSWDANDLLVSWVDKSSNASSSSVITYDENMRKTSETVTYPGGFAMGYSYAYSQAGKKTRLTWPDGTAIGYDYNKNGLLVAVTIPDEGSISLGDFNWTAPTKIVLPGGTVQYISYDGLLNPSVLKVKNPASQEVLTIANKYGALLEPIQIRKTNPYGGLTATSDYIYDASSRLAQVVTNYSGSAGDDIESFTYDAVSNRIEHSRVQGEWTYDENNRLKQRGSGRDAISYQYDDAGNLVLKIEPGNMVTKYLYNHLNRLNEVRTGAGNLIARYGYDPLGRRIWKEQYRDSQHTPLSQAIRTFSLYAEEGLIAEAEQPISLLADGSVLAIDVPSIVNQYGPRPDAQFTTGILFVKTKNSVGAPIIAYYHHDQRLAPVLATDRSGSVVWSATYDAYGNVSITTPKATEENPTIVSKLRLPGQIEDSETGLNYNYFRDYDPQTGRYIQSDPIGLVAGINTYGYVRASPLFGIDPYGLQDSIDRQNRPPKIPSHTEILGYYSSEMDRMNIKQGKGTGPDNVFHCVAACKAKKAGYGVGFIRATMNSKEYLDYIRGRLGLYGNRVRKDHKEMVADINHDMAVNEVGLSCPADRSCEEQCEQFVKSMAPKSQERMREWMASPEYRRY